MGEKLIIVIAIAVGVVVGEVAACFLKKVALPSMEVSAIPSEFRRELAELDIPLVSKWYYVKGLASYYGPGFEGKITANGESYDPWGYTCAHKTIAFGKWLEVRNPANNRSIYVRVNDRGPFIDGRDLDLSVAAYNSIARGDEGAGVLKVEWRICK